ncbi:hypothetical protein GCM10027299_54040 [Larkinella ripae]
MKQPMNTRILFILSYFLSVGPILAQTDTYVPASRWQLHTDAVSHQTVVAFYDDHNRLIYQEVLPGQHVRLTRKNIRRLDQASARLASNQLVASVISPDLLTADAGFAPTETGVGRSALLGAPLAESATDGFRATVVPAPRARIAVYYQNTESNPVSIQLLDPSGQPVYRETSTHPSYKRYLDLDKLGLGVYQLTLSTAQYRYQYRLRVHAYSEQNRPVLLSAHGEPMRPKPDQSPLQIVLNHQQSDGDQGRERLGEENLFIRRGCSVKPGDGDAAQKKEGDVVLPNRVADEQ